MITLSIAATKHHASKLRHLVRIAGRERVEQHWTGDLNSFRLILRLAGIPALGPVVITEPALA